tara:strand:- start:200 stop:415 length:216 start_codon:yes stop_codon:yes gene_type:complete
MLVLSVSTSLLKLETVVPKEPDVLTTILELVGVVGELMMTWALVPVAVKPVVPVRLLIAVLIAEAVVLLSE